MTSNISEGSRITCDLKKRYVWTWLERSQLDDSFELSPRGKSVRKISKYYRRITFLLLDYFRLHLLFSYTNDICNFLLKQWNATIFSSYDSYCYWHTQSVKSPNINVRIFRKSKRRIKVKTTIESVQLNHNNCRNRNARYDQDHLRWNESASVLPNNYWSDYQIDGVLVPLCLQFIYSYNSFVGENIFELKAFNQFL